MTDDRQAWLIKVAAVITAAPRWISALLAAEGLALPAAWLGWWLPLSAIMAACMAIVEGVAFAYVFAAWRKTSGRQSNVLVILAAVCAALFALVLAPYIAASVRGVQLSAILAHDLALYAWAGAVALSTLAIVAAVGYAQRPQIAQPARKPAEPAAAPAQAPATVAEPAALLPAPAEPMRCACGYVFEPGRSLPHQRAAHAKTCPDKRKNGHKLPEKEIINHAN